MVTENQTSNWKYALAAGAFGLAATAGLVYCYRKSDKKPNFHGSSLDLDSQPENKISKAVGYKDSGNKFFKAGQYQKALELYNEALKVCPKEDKMEMARIYQNKAVALENLGEKDEALKCLNDALTLYPKYEKALNRRSKHYEANNKLRESLIDVTAASYFDEFKTAEYVSRMDDLIKKVARVEADLLEMKRQVSLPSKSYLCTYFESFPSDPLMHDDTEAPEEPAGDTGSVELLERCLGPLRQHRFEDSFREVRTVLDANPDGGKVPEETRCRLLLLRGTFLLLASREEGALSDLKEVADSKLATPAVTVSALIKKAMVLMATEQYDRAEAAFTVALQIDPACPDIYYHRGSLMESLERYQDAQNDFSRSVELNPRYSFAAVHKAFNDFRLHMSPSYTFEEFDRLIKDYPKCLECHLIYSQVLLNLGRFEDVRRVCEKYLRLEPTSASILMILAMAKMSTGHEIDAKRLLEEAIKGDPKYPYAYQTLASVLMKEGQMQAALELIEKAIPLAKSRAEVLAFIATREGMRAQLSVALTYGIDPSQIFESILRSVGGGGAFA